MEKTKKELIAWMTKKVNKLVKHYKTDLQYDIEALEKMEDGDSRLWTLRKTGTYFFGYGTADGMDANVAVIENWGPENIKAWEIGFYNGEYHVFVVDPVEYLQLAKRSLEALKRTA
jgi:hypothetical protein